MITSNHHGLIENKKCQTNLIYFDEVTSWVDEGNAVGIMYLDFNKAFVKVLHDLTNVFYMAR